MAELQHYLGCPREDWGDYPLPHYDEEDTCRCPDHVAMRGEKSRRREQRRVINSTNAFTE
jgi:hypothetical protein